MFRNHQDSSDSSEFGTSRNEHQRKSRSRSYSPKSDKILEERRRINPQNQYEPRESSVAAPSRNERERKSRRQSYITNRDTEPQDPSVSNTLRYEHERKSRRRSYTPTSNELLEDGRPIMFQNEYEPQESSVAGPFRNEHEKKFRYRSHTPIYNDILEERRPVQHKRQNSSYRDWFQESPRPKERRSSYQYESRHVPDVRNRREEARKDWQRAAYRFPTIDKFNPTHSDRCYNQPSTISDLELEIVQYLMEDNEVSGRNVYEICRDLHIRNETVFDLIRRNILTIDKLGNVNLMCPVDLCEKHWTSTGCENGESCNHIHICKFYIIGNCKSSNCKFGHNLYTNHSKALLTHFSADIFGESNTIRLLQLSKAVRSKGVPPICTFYNNSNCQKGNKCPFMHICSHYLTKMSCRNGSTCLKSHDLLESGAQEILKKYGVDVNIFNIDSVLIGLRAAYSSTSEITDTTNPMLKVSLKTRRLPQVCVFHNRPGGCEKGHRCEFLHICKRYVMDNSCHFSNCRYFHNFTNHQTLTCLAKFGINVWHIGKEKIVKLLRKDMKAPNETVTKDVTERKSEKRNEICTFNLQKRCKRSDINCRYHHSTKPYLWQFESCGKWKSFSDANSQQLEKTFCDPKKESVLIQEDKSGEMRVDFQMMQYNGPAGGRIQRLSTKSWGEAYENKPFVTKWSWYWLDEHSNWNEYENPKDIEEQCLKGEAEFRYTYKHHEYIIEFKEMRQENKVTKTKRDVRRRPRLNRSSVSETQEGMLESKYPNTWQISSEDDAAKIVELTPGSPEYQDVKRRFSETMKVPIQTISRVENPDLWEEYYNMKRRMFKKRVGTVPTDTDLTLISAELNEKLLFHGTKKTYMKPIYEHRGFDFRNAGSSSGTLWGKGNYFASDASYSSSYTDCNEMFAVRVLIGDTTQGNSAFVKPPPKDRSNPYGSLYDTCVDNPRNPSIYVTFEFGQSYPAYLIRY